MNINSKKHRVLTPMEYSGSLHGDYGYEIDGVRSEIGYVSRVAAYEAMYRRIERDARRFDQRGMPRG